MCFLKAGVIEGNKNKMRREQRRRRAEKAFESGVFSFLLIMKTQSGFQVQELQG